MTAQSPGRVIRLEKAWTTSFFVVDQILEASNHAERAGVLLRLPDTIINCKAEQLQDACNEVGFTAGSDYVAIRLAHQCVLRDRQGNLPAATLAQLEYWRNGMVAISEGTR